MHWKTIKIPLHALMPSGTHPLRSLRRRADVGCSGDWDSVRSTGELGVALAARISRRLGRAPPLPLGAASAAPLSLPFCRSAPPASWLLLRVAGTGRAAALLRLWLHWAGGCICSSHASQYQAPSGMPGRPAQ